MLNYVALYLVEYLVNNHFKSEGMVVRTEEIQDSARLVSLVAHTLSLIHILKNNLPKEDTSAPAACFSQEQAAGDAGIPKKVHLKTMNPPAKNFPKIFSRKVLTFCFLGDIMGGTYCMAGCQDDGTAMRSGVEVRYPFWSLL